MKPGEKVLFMALWLLNLSLHFSGFLGFLLKLWVPPYSSNSTFQYATSRKSFQTSWC